MRNEKTNLMVQSDSTRSECILQEKYLKIFERSTHTWTPLNNVPLIPGPLYARCSTHIWTPILLMFHSYCDPISINVPLLPGPHRAECSTHTWTLMELMFHSYLDPIIINVPFIPGPPLYCINASMNSRKLSRVY